VESGGPFVDSAGMEPTDPGPTLFEGADAPSGGASAGGEGRAGERVFRRWDVDQGDLFPPTARELVPPGHLVHMLRSIVQDELDLSGIYGHYRSPKGQPPYHPALMVALLLYGYCRGIYTSRKLEMACEERLGFRALDQIKRNTGKHPQQISADSGYCSEENLKGAEAREIDAYVATGRQRHGSSSATSNEEAGQGPRTTAMCEKLRAGGWDSPYRLRKHTVEPVFGQVKGARGFREFLCRGAENVRGEWALLCTDHNLLKLAIVRAATAA